MKERSGSFVKVNNTFPIVSPLYLASSSDDEIFNAATEFYERYSEDVSCELANQLLSFKACFGNSVKKMESEKHMLEFILIENYSSCTSFSEIITACYMFLTIPVTIASAERSFSKLKIIKNFLRSTMGQERLSSLSVLSIENETARNLDICQLIKAFAEAKARKKHF